ncbi:gas vesicle protein [Streptomyces sp. NPDC057592]|uniref:gas vesicle protein GvpO n=1 Tax=unclassified Streptomyces TaxID=2593676 RepID=UPI0036CB7E95
MAEGEEGETESFRHPAGKKTAGKSSTIRASGSASGIRRAPRRVSAPQAMRYAAEQFQELLGRVPESASALKQTEDGWQADVEVLELERVPGTTSVMASYQVLLDKGGELVSYERTRRYTRGQIDRG